MAKAHDLPTRGLSPPPRFLRQGLELLTPKHGSAPMTPFLQSRSSRFIISVVTPRPAIIQYGIPNVDLE